MYRAGEIQDAYALMVKCAQAGDPIACLLAQEWIASINPNPDVNWMKKLEDIAHSGVAEAQWELSQCYRFGNYVNASVNSANYWLEKSAEGGWPEANLHLSWYMASEQYGYELDIRESERRRELAINAGSAEAIYLKAIEIIDTDRESAIMMLRDSASKGFQPAVEVLKNFSH
ncbi:TPR repeat protein [Methylopila jiangsuensis]|nr:hypothetical protein [Methylopila jiangsuensis]MDR6284023.1 TPR repeat protein [Methylopila jiangsuensis]